LFAITLRPRAQKGEADQALGRSCGGLSTKIHVRADAKGHPLAFALTGGEAHGTIGVWPDNNILTIIPDMR
jgi:hypothetical protein